MMQKIAPVSIDVSHERLAPPGVNVVHLDEHLIVADKPSGLLTVPAKPPGPSDCLEARMALAFPGSLLVHRLDMDTSGIILFARTRLAQRHIGWQFERRQLRKTYEARVAGHMTSDSGQIDLPLICDWPNRPRQMVCHERGKPALTDWKVMDREPGGVTRVELAPKTGRSHQLRVHLLAIGHPILGDNFYADPETLATASRLQLHSRAIELRHPDGGAWVTYEAPTPF